MNKKAKLLTAAAAILAALAILANVPVNANVTEVTRSQKATRIVLPPPWSETPEPRPTGDASEPAYLWFQTYAPIVSKP